MYTVGGLTIDQLGVVHATKYKPPIEQGTLKIPTTFDALGGLDQSPDRFVFRNTVHTSLNGVVGSHMMGNWNEMAYVVVAPFREATRLNGPPAGFCTVDTYWAMDLATPLQFRKFKVVSPAPSSEDFGDGDLFREDGHFVYYKTEMNDQDRLFFLRHFLTERHPRYPDISVNDELYYFAETLSRHNVTIIPRDYYIDTDADIENLEAIILSSGPNDLEIIDGLMRQTIRDYATYHALSGYNCPARECGNDYWVDDLRNTGEPEMAVEVRALHHGKHCYSKQYELEKMIHAQDVMGRIFRRPAPREIEKFLADHAKSLPAGSVNLVRRLILHPLYDNAREARDRLLAGMNSQHLDLA
ncbi:MAG: hypothetical protein EOM26_03385 [Alphaproteobacteria bacterium]|nr:hypothetical protein [Alphaproteobacteria bacterium]